MKTLVPTLLAIFSLGCFGFSQRAHAVSPPPDGGYAGGNTAEGHLALGSLNTSVGVYNTAVGIYSLLSITDGDLCTAVGAGTLFSNTANENTAIGAGALFSNTTGAFNTANGAFALFSNATGARNTAAGVQALFSNTTDDNTAYGYQALLDNTTGTSNTATGTQTLMSNTTGQANTATGFHALQSNTIGLENTASGQSTLLSNTIGSSNTATGSFALVSNTEGTGNTASGAVALLSNTTGNYNTAYGRGALESNTSGSFNTAIGHQAGFNQTFGNANVYIGDGIGGVAGESNACYIASIFGQTSASGTPVLINSSNKLGTATSSKRFKKDIKPMGAVSEALFSLTPVTFQYKKEIDPAGTLQLGLVAEDVEKVHPDLVVRDKEGKPYSVRYDQVNAMLLNEFLKEHRKVEQQDATIAQLRQDFQSRLAEQQKKIEALTKGLEKVNAELEVTKPVPQRVAVNVR
jgi:Chaperone of endosialidase